MNPEWKVSVLLFVSLVGSFLTVGLSRRFALSRGIVDVPNARSSHHQPVPRGGGFAIVVVVSICIATLAALGSVPRSLALALLIPGGLTAGVGYIDDLMDVSAPTRLCVHLVAAVAALALLGGWSPEWIQRGSGAWLILQVATVIGIVWSVNLFNFMDGIDGIAGSEAVYLGISGALLMSIALPSPGVALASLVVAAACGGFLIWNWPPAKIFMGDVGSGYLGLVFAVLALESARQYPILLLVWIILGANFLIDAGTTLIRRLIRRERVYQAHRTHAYQWLARRFRSHSAVTLLYLAINVAWLLPMAWLILRFPGYAPWITIAALAPILLGALAAGAGRLEIRSMD